VVKPELMRALDSKQPGFQAKDAALALMALFGKRLIQRMTNASMQNMGLP
jgi:hypothetical protein